jgi:hypothetical protein
MHGFGVNIFLMIIMTVSQNEGDRPLPDEYPLPLFIKAAYFIDILLFFNYTYIKKWNFLVPS